VCASRRALLPGCIVIALSCIGFAQQPVQSQPVNQQVQLDQIQRSLTQVQQDVERLRSGNWIKDYMPLIATLITAVVAIYSLRSNLSMTMRTLQEKSREEERKAIREKIDQFYGPFMLLRAKSKSLYEDLFLARRTDDERRRFAGPDGRYRTVLALVRGYQFNEADRAMLEQITQIGQETATLIQTKMGLVDDEDLRLVLSKATVHYWVMQQLMQGKLVKNEEFGRFVFPRELDDKVEARLATLSQRLTELQEYS